jgi:glutathione S-transferase
MKEGDFVLNESKAIISYIAGNYDKTGKLYPKNPAVRAKIDSRMFFHDCTFYAKVTDVMVSFYHTRFN